MISGVEIQYVLNLNYEVFTSVHADTEKRTYKQMLCTNEHSPIKNLIWTTRVKFARSSLSVIQTRLGPHSTILCLQGGMGVLAETVAQYFQDSHSRPLFIEGYLSKNVCQGDNFPRKKDGLSHDIHKYVGRPQRNNLFENIFTATASDGESGEPAFMAVGPPEIPEKELPRATRRRLSQAEYFRKKLRDAPGINTKDCSKRKLLLVRWKRLFVDSIVGSMCALKGCLTSEVLQDLESRKRCALLLEEAFQVLSCHRLSLHREDCADWITRYAKINTGRHHRMAVQCFNGRDTGAEDFNGWFVERGRLLETPCPEHEKLLNEVKLKTEQQKEIILKLREEAVQKKIRREERGRKGESSKDDDKYRLTKLEKRRLRKTLRQRALLGKQEMPSHIAAPLIRRVGNRELKGPKQP